MEKPRGFHCSFRDTVCDDGRCKIDYCALEHDLERDYGQPRSSARPYTDPELLKEAKHVAKQVLQHRGIKATPELISKLIKHPKILEKAQSQLDWLRKLN
jgi:hypothetical protein